MPATMPQKGGDPAVAVPAELTGKLNDRLGQRLLILLRARLVSLCRARMTRQPASAPLRNPEELLHVVDTLAAT